MSPNTLIGTDSSVYQLNLSSAVLTRVPRLLESHEPSLTVDATVPPDERITHGDDLPAETVKMSPNTLIGTDSAIDQAFARYGGSPARAPGPPSAEAVREMVKSLDSYMGEYTLRTYNTKEEEKFPKSVKSFEPSGAVIEYLRYAYPQTHTEKGNLSDGDNLQSPEAFLYAMGFESFEVSNQILANLTDLQTKVESAASYYQDGGADGKNPWRVDEGVEDIYQRRLKRFVQLCLPAMGGQWNAPTGFRYSWALFMEAYLLLLDMVGDCYIADGYMRSKEAMAFLRRFFDEQTARNGQSTPGGIDMMKYAEERYLTSSCNEEGVVQIALKPGWAPCPEEAIEARQVALARATYILGKNTRCYLLHRRSMSREEWQDALRRWRGEGAKTTPACYQPTYPVSEEKHWTVTARECFQPLVRGHAERDAANANVLHEINRVKREAKKEARWAARGENYTTERKSSGATSNRPILKCVRDAYGHMKRARDDVADDDWVAIEELFGDKADNQAVQPAKKVAVAAAVTTTKPTTKEAPSVPLLCSITCRLTKETVEGYDPTVLSHPTMEKNSVPFEMVRNKDRKRARRQVKASRSKSGGQPLHTISNLQANEPSKWYRRDMSPPPTPTVQPPSTQPPTTHWPLPPLVPDDMFTVAAVALSEEEARRTAWINYYLEQGDLGSATELSWDGLPGLNIEPNLFRSYSEAANPYVTGKQRMSREEHRHHIAEANKAQRQGKEQGHQATKEYLGMINKAASTISACWTRRGARQLASDLDSLADVKKYQVHAKMAPGSSRHPPSVWYKFEVKAHRTLDYLINLAASSFGIDRNNYYPVIESQYHDPQKTMGESFTRDVLSLVFRRGGRGGGNPRGSCGEGSSTDPYEVEPADNTKDGEETYPTPPDDDAAVTTTDDAAPHATSEAASIPLCIVSRCQFPRYRVTLDNGQLFEHQFCSLTCARVWNELMQRPGEGVPKCALPGCERNAAPLGSLRNREWHECCGLRHRDDLIALRAAGGEPSPGGAPSFSSTSSSSQDELEIIEEAPEYHTREEPETPISDDIPPTPPQSPPPTESDAVPYPEQQPPLPPNPPLTPPQSPPPTETDAMPYPEPLPPLPPSERWAVTHREHNRREHALHGNGVNPQAAPSATPSPPSASAPPAPPPTLMDLGDDVIRHIVTVLVERDQLLNAFYAWIFTNTKVNETLRRLYPRDEDNEVEEAEQRLNKLNLVLNDALLATFNNVNRVDPVAPHGDSWFAQLLRSTVSLPFTNLTALTHTSLMVLEHLERPTPPPDSGGSRADNRLPYHGGSYFLGGLPVEFYSIFGFVCLDLLKLRVLQVSETEQRTGGLGPFWLHFYRRCQLQPDLHSRIRQIRWIGNGPGEHAAEEAESKHDTETVEDAPNAPACFVNLRLSLKSQRFPYLQELQLINCGVTDDSLIALSPALWQLQSLLRLNLMDNGDISAAGWKLWLTYPERAQRRQPNSLEPLGLQSLRTLDMMGTGADHTVILACQYSSPASYPLYSRSTTP